MSSGAGVVLHFAQEAGGRWVAEVDPMVAALPAFAAALLIAVAATLGVRALAPRVGLVDLPDGRRRLHARPVPRAGGVAVYLGFAIVAGLTFLAVDGLSAARENGFRAMLVGAATIFGIGLWDDFRGLPPRMKFLLETVVATGLFFTGVRLHALSIPGSGSVPLPELVSYLLTVLWIVGVTNAFNLIDGADGVAAGAALFASLAMALVSAATGHAFGALISLTLAGATLGFLFFNFPPASIFLGDSGSLTLGFVLACMGLLTAQMASTTVAVAIPVVSLGLPILDTSLAIVRRFLRGERIFNADRGHIHHRLRDLGASPRSVTLLLYAACAAFALLSLLLVHPDPSVGALFIVAGVVVLVAVQRLRIPEIQELRRIVRRGLVQRTAIGYNVRVRHAVQQMSLAADPAAIVAALEAGLDTGEFTGAELWLDDGVADPFLQARLARRESRGAAWTWGDRFARTREWEFRLTIHGPDERLGRLSLWHPIHTDHVLTNLQLLAAELEPELGRALVRARERGTLEGGVATARAVTALAAVGATPA